LHPSFHPEPPEIMRSASCKSHDASVLTTLNSA
jgi:hypothetical protein